MASWRNNPKNFELRTREEAAAAGLSLYYSGKPCKHGHLAPRYVSTAGCLGCLNRFKELNAKNAYSHDLVPYAAHAPLWRSKRLTSEQLAELDRYLQTCIDTYCKHALPELCKTCDGTNYIPVKGEVPPRWEACPTCMLGVPTGTEAAT